MTATGAWCCYPAEISGGRFHSVGCGRARASVLFSLLLPRDSGPIERIAAAVTKAGVPEHFSDPGDPGDEDDNESKRAEQTRALEREWYAAYRREIGETGRSVPQYSDPAGGNE